EYEYAARIVLSGAMAETGDTDAAIREAQLAVSSNPGPLAFAALAEAFMKAARLVSLCRRCGRCPMAEILNATDGMDLPIYVSTGGTQARRIVSERRPKVIVAVACERELTEGIRDVGGIPVVGVVNRRPHGPCYNTDVEVEKLIAAVKGILPEG
ncbi:MAG: DUF116 domain-containing protein, partial [Bacillota bacterium]